MGIRSALKARHPVWVFIITFFSTPLFGFMYVNRGRLALAYLAFLILFVIATGVAAEYGIDAEGTILDIFFLIIYISCAVYSIYLVKKYGLGPKIKWYAKFAVVYTFFGISLLILALPLRTFLIEPINIPSGSMEPTVPRGDYVLIDKTIYGYSQYSFPFHLKLWEGKILARKPQRGDIVVFALPSSTNATFMKRIVGLPGDEIQMKEGHLYINNTPVKSEIVGEFILNERQQGLIKMIRKRETLPEGKSYDIIEENDDGPLDNTMIYKVPDGHYFVLGDNRDYSQDSRDTNLVGPVPEENIFGRAAYFFYSGTEQRIVFRKIE
jgi:signal peptidase I